MDDIIALFRFIDWLVTLPEELETELHERIKEDLEGKKTMPYVSSIERFARERGFREGKEQGKEEGKAEGKSEGKAEGLRKGLLTAALIGLSLRFGENGLTILPRVREITDLDHLERFVAALPEARSLEDLCALWLAKSPPG